MTTRKSIQAFLYLVLQLLLMSAACRDQYTIEEHSHEQVEYSNNIWDNFSHILNDDGKC